MSTTSNNPSRAARFLAALRRAQSDRGKMASLRRAASPATERQAWPVIHHLGEDIRNAAALTIGALFAQHPKEDDSVFSFGATCRRIATDNGREREIPESFERRFRRLLACDSVADVTGQLKPWIRFAAAKGIGVNYERLFNDLAYWEKSSEEIRIRWAVGFWPLRTEKESENVKGEEDAA
jgi:CRISPR type I-E-associated protein CasB/Cse2